MTEKRVCGDCQMCCKVMGVLELDKPRNTWCSHVIKGKGCGIYDKRPPTCAEFECLWLQGMIPGPSPKHTHCVMTTTGGGDGICVYVDPGYPDAYKKLEWLEHLSRTLPVIITNSATHRCSFGAASANMIINIFNTLAEYEAYELAKTTDASGDINPPEHPSQAKG